MFVRFTAHRTSTISSSLVCICGSPRSWQLAHTPQALKAVVLRIGTAKFGAHVGWSRRRALPSQIYPGRGSSCIARFLHFLVSSLCMSSPLPLVDSRALRSRLLLPRSSCQHCRLQSGREMGAQGFEEINPQIDSFVAWQRDMYLACVDESGTT